jgi:hypothetical protein
VLLVLVPTLFTVFPHWADWGVGLRVGIVTAWVCVAVVVVYASARQSEGVDELIDAERRRRSEARLAAGRYVLEQILRPGAEGFPEHYEFRLFAPDPQADVFVLREEYASTGELTDERWEPGQGVTGAAWSSASLVRARGAPVSDGTYRLTREQQERYRQLAVVAAAPLLDARKRPIAVLSTASREDDGFIFEGDGAARLAALADAAARILIDLVVPARAGE